MKSGLDPALLELELTESMLVKNTEEIIATLIGLKRMGVLLSLDDFGTGYSALSYLARLPLEFRMKRMTCSPPGRAGAGCSPRQAWP